MKRKSILFVVITILSLALFSITFFKKHEKTLTRQLKINNHQKESLNYLKSYDNAKIEISEHDSIFNATKKLSSLSKIELLNTSNSDLTEYFFDFETIYVKDIGLVYMKVLLKKNDNSIDQINVTGYPFFNKNINKPDVSFEYFGDKILASDLTNKKVDNQTIGNNKFFIMQLDDGGGSSVDVTMPILEISLAIINSNKDLIQDTINKLKETEMDFWIDGPIHYVLWEAKKLLAIQNYMHNRKLSIPAESLKDGYIDKQNEFFKWKFGLKHLSDNGCGVISLYNFLVSQNRKPDLASLILLIELMNADLGFGCLGTNFISNELMQICSMSVTLSIRAMIPFLELFVPIIAGKITEKLIEDQLNLASHWWQKMLIYMSVPAVYKITLNTVYEVVLVGVTLIDVVTNFYLKHLHGIPDILEVLGYKELDNIYLSYDDFNQNREQYGYFIITFFNNVPNFTNFSELENFTAHIIFIKRKYKNKSELLTYNNGENIMFNNFTSFFTSNYATRNRQFIAGTTIKG